MSRCEVVSGQYRRDLRPRLRSHQRLESHELVRMLGQVVEERCAVRVPERGTTVENRIAESSPRRPHCRTAQEDLGLCGGMWTRAQRTAERRQREPVTIYSDHAEPTQGPQQSVQRRWLAACGLGQLLSRPGGPRAGQGSAGDTRRK